MKVELLGLRLPEIRPGDDLAGIIVDYCEREIGGIKDYDIIVVTSKIVSKANNLLVRFNDVKPSGEAVRIS